ncbi:gustatory receptor for bitter taste 66a-like [Uranotaenia lowii]|uniref:gustatory receptor for bitter taste 66a-like n=1 Tax=Uranotaenia lowii TaxID=190385 RepID=UPI00247986E2|nr:gustatory receptor for bitter taste 66a-like [Uranotaenia lowii]
MYDEIKVRAKNAISKIIAMDLNEKYWNQRSAIKSKRCQSVAQELSWLCCQHRMLTKLFEEFRSIFDLPLALITLLQVIEVIAETFYCYTGIVHAIREGYTPDYTYYGLSLLSALVLGLQFYYLTSFGHNLTKMANSVSIELHEFFLTEVDELLDVIIEFFSLELSHQDYSVHILGLFTLDRKFAFGVAGVITTYLILMVQFELAQA